MKAFLLQLLQFIEEAFGGTAYATDETPPETPQNQPEQTKPVEPVNIPPKPKTSVLETFCSTIKLREGANPANNNPGNCKYYYGGYLPIYGTVRRSIGGFAMFPTYEQGWLYLENTVKEIIKQHPGLTFYTFFAGDGKEWGGYAPASDHNDPISYSQQVADACHYPVDTVLAPLIS